jgi:hypothetical protein
MLATSIVLANTLARSAARQQAEKFVSQFTCEPFPMATILVGLLAPWKSSITIKQI